MVVSISLFAEGKISLFLNSNIYYSSKNKRPILEEANQYLIEEKAVGMSNTWQRKLKSPMGTNCHYIRSSFVR